MSVRRTAPLIAAKLVVPPARPAAVSRPRLHERLRSGADTRLTAVVAPAGWGKTTLLSQWAHDVAETRGVVWVSLDEADDDPVRFWTYVLTALHQGVVGIDEAPLQALATPGLEPVDMALPVLLNELVALDGTQVLVLDDYHLLSDPRIHEGVEFLLTYLPPSLRVVIAGRSDPPLPLARLRARGELTELRAADLGFRPDEATALLAAVGDEPADPDAAAALCERTEGWAAGLRLAVLAVRGAEDPAAAAATVHGDDRHILDYLSVEVLDRLPGAHRDLLVRTSVLERLSGPLCDAVLGRHGSGADLEALERADLFVVPLDPRREWYRCHRLFRDVLRHELEAADPAGGSRVLGAAAEWFLARDHVAEAVDHRIRAGDERGAGDLLRSTVPWFLERGALGEHLRLGSRLSPSTVRADPGLGVALAWAAGLDGRFSLIGARLDAAEPRITDDVAPLEGWRSVRGAAATVRAVEISVLRADATAALAVAGRGVELEDDPDVAGYVLARTVLGAVLCFTGAAEEAVPPLETAWDRARVLGLPPVLALQCASILAVALAETGRWDRLRRLLAEAAPGVRDAEERWGGSWGGASTPGVARLRCVEGALARTDGDLHAARALLQRTVEDARTFGEAPGLLTALSELAEVELAAGDRDAARAVIAQARDVVAQEPVLPLFTERIADLARRAGRAVGSGAARPRHAPHPAGGVTVVEELTDRERAVLAALTGNATQREIGAALYLSVNTVKGYTKVLYRKLGVSTRDDAVRHARRIGLL